MVPWGMGRCPGGYCWCWGSVGWITAWTLERRGDEARPSLLMESSGGCSGCWHFQGAAVEAWRGQGGSDEGLVWPWDEGSCTGRHKEEGTGEMSCSRSCRRSWFAGDEGCRERCMACGWCSAVGDGEEKDVWRGGGKEEEDYDGELG